MKFKIKKTIEEEIELEDGLYNLYEHRDGYRVVCIKENKCWEIYLSADESDRSKQVGIISMAFQPCPTYNYDSVIKVCKKNPFHSEILEKYIGPLLGNLNAIQKECDLILGEKADENQN